MRKKKDEVLVMAEMPVFHNLAGSADKLLEATSALSGFDDWVYG